LLSLVDGTEFQSRFQQNWISLKGYRRCREIQESIEKMYRRLINYQILLKRLAFQLRRMAYQLEFISKKNLLYN
jgi:hypothetical protein